MLILFKKIFFSTSKTQPDSEEIYEISKSFYCFLILVDIVMIKKNICPLATFIPVVALSSESPQPWHGMYDPEIEVCILMNKRELSKLTDYIKYCVCGLHFAFV